jgi:hypothetical protein
MKNLKIFVKFFASKLSLKGLSGKKMNKTSHKELGRTVAYKKVVQWGQQHTWMERDRSP